MPSTRFAVLGQSGLPLLRGIALAEYNTPEIDPLESIGSRTRWPPWYRQVPILLLASENPKFSAVATMPVNPGRVPSIPVKLSGIGARMAPPVKPNTPLQFASVPLEKDPSEDSVTLGIVLLTVIESLISQITAELKVSLPLAPIGPWGPKLNLVACDVATPSNPAIIMSVVIVKMRVRFFIVGPCPVAAWLSAGSTGSMPCKVDGRAAAISSPSEVTLD